MQPEFWNDKRPAGVPDSLDFAAYRSVVEVFERSCKKFADRPAQPCNAWSTVAASRSP